MDWYFVFAFWLAGAGLAFWFWLIALVVDLSWFAKDQELFREDVTLTLKRFWMVLLWPIALAYGVVRSGITLGDALREYVNGAGRK